MDKSMVDSVVRIIVIVALLLSVVSILLPWGDIGVEGMLTYDFYSWGFSSQRAGIFTGSDQETGLYVSLFFNEDFVNLIMENEELFGFIFPMVFGVLALPLLVIGLVFGAWFLVAKGDERFKNLRDAGVFIVAAVIFYYIFIQFGLLSFVDTISGRVSEYVSLSSFFLYSTGFYLALVAVIMIFGVFIVHKEVLEKQFLGMDVKKTDDEVLRLLQTRYVKGEISKEEYEQMKKDIG